VDARHNLTTFLLPLRSWGTLVVPKSTSSGWDISVFEHKLKAQANYLKGKELSALVLSARIEHNRKVLVPSLVRGKRRAQAFRPPTPLLKRGKHKLLTRNVRNSLKLVAVKRSHSLRDDLARCVETLVKTSKRRQNDSLEAPIINRLLTRKSVMQKGLEAALHGCCTRGSDSA
jgi:hypothetical protein